MAEQIYNQYRGALMGLAVGDALGAPFEGLSRGAFGPVEIMAGGGPHKLEPGQWTGNTSMALCLAAAMSRTTHAAEEAVDACRYLTGLMVGAFRGESKEALLSDHYSPVYHYWFFPQIKLARKVSAIAAGSYKQKEAEDLPASGHVIDTLEAALWCFWRTGSFREGALLAVSLGNDAGTTAAVYGQLAGAYYGVEAIPGEWRETVAQGRMIEEMAASLLEATRQGIRHLSAI